MEEKNTELEKFELQKYIQLEELELKKKELELRIQEQNSKKLITPLTIAIITGFFTLITGIVLKYFENTGAIELEDRKFQSSLLLKAFEAENYEVFSEMLKVFTDNDIITINETEIDKIRRSRLIAFAYADQKVQDSIKQYQNITDPTIQKDVFWIIVAGGDANLKGAKYEQHKAKILGLENVNIWFREGVYRTTIGKFSSYEDAVINLFEVKEKMNNSSYIVRIDKWCNKYEYNNVDTCYLCK